MEKVRVELLDASFCRPIHCSSIPDQTVQEQITMSAAEFKAKGNAEFAAKNYDAAIKHYTDAIAAVSGEADAPHVLYSNRSACHSGLRNYSEALKDAEKVRR